MKNWIILFSIILGCSFVVAQKEDPYADSPSWYKPGHPLDPAEPAGIDTLPGFKVEKLMAVPEAAGSITAMATDDEGNLVVAMQHQPGLYRVVPTELGSGEQGRLEPLGGEARSVGWCQGLLYAFDSLYVTVAEKNGLREPGLYRLKDTNGDGEFDQVDEVLALSGAGEHGPHNLVAGPDGNSLYFICGNGTPLPEVVQARRTVSTDGYDHLMPDGFENTQYTEACWVVRMDPDGSNPELVAAGLRNAYDIAFNKHGDLFTFDSDMEYDLGAPWYRPTRICHLVSGSEFGWRGGAGKWPEYYEDSVRPVVNIGPSSPTGVIFGYESTFPGKYKDAFYVLDWTFATLYAIHLKPDGATYSADVEIFASGVGLPLTDVVISSDGAMYFSVGGRRLGSAIYRIYYDGPEGVYEASHSMEGEGEASRDLRLALESYHGKEKAATVNNAWNHLGSEDASIRYAARIAVESQPVDSWRGQALAEENVQIQLPALLALSRQGNVSDLLGVLDELEQVDLGSLSEEGLLLALRVYERALAKGGFELKSIAVGHTDSLKLLMPHESRYVNRELSRILCYLEETSVIDEILNLMESDKGEENIAGADLVERNVRYGGPMMAMMQAAPMVDRMHHAAMLNWIHDGWSLDQRRRYFQSVVEAMQSSKGGVGYAVYWRQILDIAKQALSDEDQTSLAAIWAPVDVVEELPKPQGPGKLWELDYLLNRVSQGFGKRDFENGKKMYAAATCSACHVLMGQGGISGPDLTAVGQRFTVKDVLDAIINPSNAISDQYQLMTLQMKNGEVLSGRIHSKDTSHTVISPNALKSTVTRNLPNADIVSVTLLPVSSMPPGLLNALNEDEVLDLLAYIMAGGHYEHALYAE